MIGLNRSLFRNIVLWYTFCVTALAIVFALFFYAEIENGRRAPFDLRLVNQAYLLAERVRNTKEDLDLTYLLPGELSKSYFAIYRHDWQSSLLKSVPWWQVQWQTNLIDFASLDNSISNNIPYFGETVSFHGQRFRFVVVPANVKALEVSMFAGVKPTIARDVFIVYADLYEDNNQYLGISIHRLAFITVGFLLLIFVSSHFVAKFGIRPILRMAKIVSSISPEDPQTRVPIDKLPIELKYLALQLNEAFDRLESALQSERTFTGAAAHELRSPVAGIASRLDSLSRRDDINDSIRNDITHLHADAKRLTNLSGRLLLLARLDRAAAGEDFPTTTVDLEEVTRDAIDFCLINTGQKDIEFKFEHFDNTNIEGHEEWLLRAVHNILNNAVKYSFDGDKIFVKVNSPVPGAYVKITIIDQGPGIAAEDVSHVFERFYRSQKPGTADGTGLGLAIVDDVIKAHKGKITVASGFEGKGTKVTMLFPHNRKA